MQAKSHPQVHLFSPQGWLISLQASNLQRLDETIYPHYRIMHWLSALHIPSRVWSSSFMDMPKYVTGSESGGVGGGCLAHRRAAGQEGPVPPHPAGTTVKAQPYLIPRCTNLAWLKPTFQGWALPKLSVPCQVKAPGYLQEFFCSPFILVMG